ncbi:MAG: hypothetical protein JWM86_1621 [Thermoleophilia bacterium]|nr:hypothetical protein [Thermoleophilia bacterium]
METSRTDHLQTPRPDGSRRRARLDVMATTLVAAPITVLGTFVLGRAADTVVEHGILMLIATALMVLGVMVAARHEPVVRATAILTIVVTLGVTGAVIGARSQERVVDEQVLTAEGAAMTRTAGDAMTRPTGDAMTMTKAKAETKAASNSLLAHGTFEMLGHDGSGMASLIKAKDGRTVLTLTDFTVEPGPDYVVRLVSGNPKGDSDVESGRTVSFGSLKGTNGDQQYVVPEGTDLSDVTHVYVWCRAFSVGVLRAPLA